MSYHTKNGVPHHVRAKNHTENFPYLDLKGEIIFVEGAGSDNKSSEQLLVRQFRQVNPAFSHLSNILFNIK